MYPIAYTPLITLSLHHPNLPTNSSKDATERLGTATEVNPGSKVLCDVSTGTIWFYNPSPFQEVVYKSAYHPPTLEQMPLLNSRRESSDHLSKPTVGIRRVVTIIASDERFKSSHQLETSRHYHPVSATVLYDHEPFMTFFEGSTTIRSRGLYDVPMHCSRWHTSSN